MPKSEVRDYILRLRQELTKRQGLVHEDITTTLSRLGEYHQLDIDLGKELAEIEHVLDECYPGWRNE